GRSDDDYPWSGLRPWIIRISATRIAITSRMWMNPPSVYDVSMPSSQRMTRTTTSVDSLVFRSFLTSGAYRADRERRCSGTHTTSRAADLCDRAGGSVPFGTPSFRRPRVQYGSGARAHERTAARTSTA